MRWFEDTAVHVRCTIALVFLFLTASPSVFAQSLKCVERVEVVPAGVIGARGLAVLVRSGGDDDGDDAITVLIADTVGGAEENVGGSGRVRRVVLSAGKSGLMKVLKDEVFGEIRYKQARGIAFSSDGKEVYVCDTAAARIYVHDASTGRLTSAIETAGMAKVVQVDGRDGSIWYLTTDGRIHHRFADGRTKVVLGEVAEGDGGDAAHGGAQRKPVELKGAVDFAIDLRAGELVVSQRGVGGERANDGRVVAIDFERGVLRVVAEGFGEVEGIAVLDGVGDAGCVIVVADSLSGKVYSIREGGTRREVVAEGAKSGFGEPICVRMTGGRGNEVVVSARGSAERESVLVFLDGFRD